MKLRSLTKIGFVSALAAAGALLASPAQATLFTTYEERLISVSGLLADELDTIGWPGEAERNHYTSGTPDFWVSQDIADHPEYAKAYGRCSNFLTEMLRQSYGPGYFSTDSWATDTYFSANFGTASPFARDYYNALSAGSADHFDSVSFGALKFGDIIAIKYNDRGTEGEGGEATGHVMIADGSPKKYERDGNTATTEYAVPVLDMTSNPHGVASSSSGSTYAQFPDSRAVGSTEYDGVGRGTVFFQVTENGVTGYWWGVNENVSTGFHARSDRPVTFARTTQAP